MSSEIPINPEIPSLIDEDYLEGFLSTIHDQLIAVEDLHFTLKRLAIQHSERNHLLSDMSYNAYFDYIENNLTPYIESMDELSESAYYIIKEYNEEIKKVKIFIDKYTASLNKNKLDFGLKGLLINELNMEGSDILNKYNLDRYTKTPNTNTGGKNTRKNTRKKHKKTNKR